MLSQNTLMRRFCVTVYILYSYKNIVIRTNAIIERYFQNYHQTKTLKITVTTRSTFNLKISQFSNTVLRPPPPHNHCNDWTIVLCLGV